MEIHDLIRERLESLGITQAELARRADMTPARVSTFLNGQRSVTTDTLARILYVLDLEIRPCPTKRKRK